MHKMCTLLQTMHILMKHTTNYIHKYLPSSRVSKSYKPPVVVIYGDVDDEGGGGGVLLLLGVSRTSSFTLWVMDQLISPDDLGAPLRRLVDMFIEV